MAAGPDRVFIVSPDGVLAFSPLLRRWEGPFLPPVPGALERVTAGMIDPLDNSLWLSAFDGWVHFQPDVQVWERGEAGGRLLDFAFDLAAPFEGLRLPDLDRVVQGAAGRAGSRLSLRLPSVPPARRRSRRHWPRTPRSAAPPPRSSSTHRSRTPG